MQEPVIPQMVVDICGFEPAATAFPARHCSDSYTARAWDMCVLKAHRITPKLTRTHALTPESRAALKQINFHFHDLRHEAASRLLEAGWPLHHISLMLGAFLVGTDSRLSERDEDGPARLDETLRDEVVAKNLQSSPRVTNYLRCKTARREARK